MDNKKTENFSEWYLELVQKAELMDYAPVQGTMAIRPRAYFVWEQIQRFLDCRFKEAGVQNAYFPMFVPESLLKKEAEHFAGFVPEVAWVTHGGNEQLGERLALRPTSETIMYTMYSKWVSSHRDLPLKLNQWCNIIRWDTKTLKPFLRTREFLWQEGHTAHATKQEADGQVKQALDWYRQVCEELLAIPVLQGKKTDAEKFPGADYTTTIEAIMPDGKALQCGTSHQLGQNFAKIFNIRYKTESGGEEYAWQTSWGVSTRLIGAVAMLHGDDRGLVLPPKIAPLQVVIIPIYKTEEDKALTTLASQRHAVALQAAGLSVLVDDSDRTPGWKFNEWELKGVPVRIEIGVKDLAKTGATIARRDTGFKEFYIDDAVLEKVKSLMDEIQENLLQKARLFAQEHTHAVENLEELREALEIRKGFAKAAWCGDPRCEEAVKEETGATIRLVPFDSKEGGKCVYCGKRGKETVYLAKSY
ncbi:proline--tRNA ligase [Candidatus Micrarchaeota archaeon CG09_land_8_20_14_0_10_60_16]|nr:MAG: proline--tRNA ligase [Candidatus Micrarchaeota archaeon CG09_land_8_20_14_0_10_60_16]